MLGGVMGMRRALVGLGVIGVALMSSGTASAGSPPDQPVPRAVVSHLSGSAQMLIKDGFLNGSGVVGGGQVDNHACTSTGDPSLNVDMTCDDLVSPDNELGIVADPQNPDHLLAGVNDYQLTFKGSQIQERVPTGSFVSFDGGHTWTDSAVPMGNGASGGNGDPSPALDAKFGTAHIAQLSAAAGQNGPNFGHIDVSVATSHDGGLTWSPPVTVAAGQAAISPSAVGTFLDKEWLVADNYPASPHYGRLYLTWDKLSFSRGAFLQSTIQFSFSDDAGKTWSRPKAISGSNPTFCIANQGSAGAPGACDESFFSYGVVRPDGSLAVGFINQQNSNAWEVANEFEDQILVVRSSDGGATWSDPVHVADLEDGGQEGVVFSDYPSNVDGRATQTGYQFRTGSWGNLGVDQTTGELYAVWTDNRDGQHDVAHPVTDTNVFMARSADGGATWSGPIRVTSGTADKWFPWVAARGGTVRVLFQDASYGATGTYGETLATSTNLGASWSLQRVDTALSDPDHSVWFQAGAANCLTCSRFIGDYLGMAIDTQGHADMVWTDMRRNLPVPQLGRTGKAQDAEFAQR
jgi:hypothetical protein